MLTEIVIIILVIQGIGNSYGFVRECFIAHIEEFAGRNTFSLSPKTTKVMGVFWLVSCLLFLFSALDLWMGFTQWKIISTLAVWCSEILITLYWKDSWAGSLFNIAIISAVLFM